MNVLAVNWLDIDNPQAGGAEIHFFELFERLAERGHRVRLLASGWEGCNERATVRGIDVHRVGRRHSFALRARGAFRGLLRADPPDIVIEDINKLPLYLTTLCHTPFCAIVPHLFGATAFREASWPAATVVWLAERPIPWVYRRAGFHAISESTRDDLVARGVPWDHIRVIHPGVAPVAGARPPVPASPAAPPFFLFVGRLKRYKGVDVALRALVIARREIPELTLRIAGSGDDLDRLKGLARQLDIEEAVRFLGYVPEEEKVALFRGAVANVFASPKEGWGMTIVEAAACGTPSIASDSPGLRDSVRHGETGFLVPHGDAGMLAGRMIALVRDGGLRARLGRGAAAFASSLTWDGAADRTEQHLEDIIRG
ncbi:MAG: glycosyltransferase family 4 protein [Gemmatimonadales bacterium]